MYAYFCQSVWLNRASGFLNGNASHNFPFTEPPTRPPTVPPIRPAFTASPQWPSSPRPPAVPAPAPPMAPPIAIPLPGVTHWPGLSRRRARSVPDWPLVFPTEASRDTSGVNPSNLRASFFEATFPSTAPVTPDRAHLGVTLCGPRSTPQESGCSSLVIAVAPAPAPQVPIQVPARPP